MYEYWHQQKYFPLVWNMKILSLSLSLPLHSYSHTHRSQLCTRARYCVRAKVTLMLGPASWRDPSSR